MTAPPGPGPHLPAALAQRIFDEQIAPIVLADPVRHPAPSAVLLVGQRGAGHEAWSRIRARADPRARPVVFDIDSLRQVFPGYQQLCRERGELDAARHVHADVQRWLAMSIDYLRDRGAAMIIEDDLPSPDTAELAAARLGVNPARPFPLEVAVLAVPAAVSRLALIEAAQHRYELLGTTPDPALALHDHGYASTLVVTAWADTRTDRIAVTVYHRATDTTAALHRPPAPALPGPSLPAFVQAARDQPWGPVQSRVWLRAHASLTVRAEPRWHPYLRGLAAAAAPALDPSAHQRRPGTALTFGHYPVVTTTDLDIVVDMLSHHERALIAVIDPGPDPAGSAQPVPLEWTAFHIERQQRAVEAAAVPARAQAAMWRAALTEAGLRHRADVTIITAPHTDPDAFNARFPAADFTVVLPAPDRDPATHTLHADYRQILHRPVAAATPRGPYRDLTSVRAAYRDSDPGWQRRLAPGSATAFLAVDGPARLLHISATVSLDQRLDRVIDAALATPAPGAAISDAIRASLPAAHHTALPTAPTSTPLPPAPDTGPSAGPGL